MENFNEQYEQLAPQLRELLELHNLSDAGALAELGDVENLPVELRDRIRAFDEAVAAAMFDVPVPEGLDVRILDRIRAESSPNPEPKVKPTSHTRRWVLLTAASLFAVFAIGWVVQQFIPEEITPTYRMADASEAAVRQFDMDADLAYMGQRVMFPEPDAEAPESGPTPDSHPISQRVFAYPNTTWRQVESLLGRQAIAYDLTDQDSSFRATLYVLDTEGATGSPPSDMPPLLPDLQTRNRSCGVWLADNRLYVLVVEGDLRRYQGMLDIPTGPLT